MAINPTPKEASLSLFRQRVTELTAENLALKAEIERLRAAAGEEHGGEELQAYRDAAQYDPMMEGPKFKRWDRSQLDRARRMTEAALAGGEQVREAKRLRQPDPPVSSTVRNGRMGF